MAIYNYFAICGTARAPFPTNEFMLWRNTRADVGIAPYIREV